VLRQTGPRAREGHGNSASSQRHWDVARSAKFAGGDDWDRRIEQVLERQIDYVLVLQTPNMLERAESYIHKEITVALARQARFDQGIRFVIPAMLQGIAGLERLSRLQCIDLTERDGVERLAKEILEDWHYRRRRATANQA
jgi:hypothetical protein